MDQRLAALMCGKTILCATLGVLATAGARAVDDGSTQWFRITSGTYQECCGIGGIADALPLPNAQQSFISLKIVSGTSATMSILGADRQTVFNIEPCPGSQKIPFTFSHGIVFPTRVIFHVDPGPPPYRLYWNYTLSNSPTRLRLDGELGLGQTICVDTPMRFSHSNVVAVSVPPPPVIEALRKEGDTLQFRVLGEPGFDYFVEYNETWPGGSWLALTNFRAKLQPVDALITDSPVSRPVRFYRVRQEDCLCD